MKDINLLFRAAGATLATAGIVLVLVIWTTPATAQTRELIDTRTGLNISISPDPLEGGLVVKVDNSNGPAPNVDASNINVPPMNVNISALEKRLANMNANQPR